MIVVMIMVSYSTECFLRSRLCSSHFACVQCSVTSNSFLTPWTVAHQAPLSMGFPRKEYWSGLPFPSPGDIPDPEIEPTSTALVGRFFTTEPIGKSSPFYIFIYSFQQPYEVCIFIFIPTDRNRDIEYLDQADTA